MDVGVYLRLIQQKNNGKVKGGHPLKEPHLHEMPCCLSVFLGGRGPYWHFYFFLPPMEPSPSHTADPLDLCLLTTSFLSHLPFTEHWETGQAVRPQVTCQKLLFWGQHTQGDFFSFLASPVRFLEDLGAGLALLAPVGRPPRSLITSACLTRAPHVLGALHSYEIPSPPPRELTV